MPSTVILVQLTSPPPGEMALSWKTPKPTACWKRGLTKHQAWAAAAAAAAADLCIARRTDPAALVQPAAT
jgi:hypothetical protein